MYKITEYLTNFGFNLKLHDAIIYNVENILEV